MPGVDEGTEAALAGGKEMPGCVGQTVEVAAGEFLAAAQHMMGADAGGNFQRGNGVTGTLTSPPIFSSSLPIPRKTTLS